MPDAQFVISAFLSVFMVVDPLAAIPVFLTMTAGDSVAARRRAALEASATLLIALTVMALAGSVIFRIFGITLGAFRCAGGLLLLLTAIDMLNARPSRTKTSDAEVAEGMEKERVGVVPLGIPILAGPGAIATIILLTEQSRASVPRLLVVGGAVLFTAAASLILLMTAPRMERVLKRTGLNVLNRVMGLLLAALAVQFILDGVREVFAIGRRLP